MIEGIRNFLHNATTGVKVTVVGFLVLVVAILVVALVNLLKPEPIMDTHVEVENFSEETGVPEGYQVNIEKLMWSAIESNNAFDGTVFTDAKVREGSYNEVVNGDSVTAKFIIDIPSMKYSFAVTASWTKNRPDMKDPSIYVECPHYLDVIYTDTKCIAVTPVEQVQRYLPHYDYIEGGRLVSVELRQYDVFQEHAGESYLAINVDACGDTKLLETGKNVTVKWLKSIYLDPNDYYMEVLDTCR